MERLIDLQGNYYSKEDEDIRRALDWFLSYVNPTDWKKRKAAIEKNIFFEFDNPMYKGKGMDDMVLLSDKTDRIGWYLYLAEKLLTDNTQYEVVQGARVMPIFKRLGSSLDELKQIAGLEKKIRFLIRKGRASADSILFEILAALLWTKNGWNVTIIPENPPAKTPDLFAERNGEKWFIECKRLDKTSAYSEKERAKWLKMVSYISDVLLAHNVLLDVTFHIELEELPDDFLEKKLKTKIELVTQPIHLISNDTWDVYIDFVDYYKINQHLKDWVVKYPSPQLNNIIAGKKVDATGFTSGMLAKFQQKGTGTGNGQYIDAVSKAYGITWRCDAEEAIFRKARDIRNHISEARDQLLNFENAAIQVGLETLDGEAVEDIRLDKIYNTVNSLDRTNTGIKWISCHLFQSYAPPDQTWVFDETVNLFSEFSDQADSPLPYHYLILPPEVEGENNVHWHKAKP